MWFETSASFSTSYNLVRWVILKKSLNFFLTNPYVGGETFYKRFVLVIKNMKAFVTNMEFVGFKLEMKRR